MPTKYKWTEQADLIARLEIAQNALRVPIDIMTYAALTDDRADFERHVQYYENYGGAA